MLERDFGDSEPRGGREQTTCQNVHKMLKKLHNFRIRRRYLESPREKHSNKYNNDYYWFSNVELDFEI